MNIPPTKNPLMEDVHRWAWNNPYCRLSAALFRLGKASNTREHLTNQSVQVFQWIDSAYE